MIIPSLSLNFVREASFFSKKTAQIIKSVINPPKKIGNAYSIFFMEKYPEFKGANMKITEISKAIGDRWNNLAQEQKSIYLSKAEANKRKNEPQVLEFKKSLTDREKIALNLLNLNRRAQNGKLRRSDLTTQQKEFLDSMPEPLAITARGVFLSQRLKGISTKSTNPTGEFIKAMQEWTNLSVKEQENFAKQAEQNLNTYNSNITNFLKR